MASLGPVVTADSRAPKEVVLVPTTEGTLRVQEAEGVEVERRPLATQRTRPEEERGAATQAAVAGAVALGTAAQILELAAPGEVLTLAAGVEVVLQGTMLAGLAGTPEVQEGVRGPEQVHVLAGPRAVEGTLGKAALQLPGMLIPEAVEEVEEDCMAWPTYRRYSSGQAVGAVVAATRPPKVGPREAVEAASSSSSPTAFPWAAS